MCDTNTELYEAVTSADVSYVRRLVELDADVNYHNYSDYNKTPLHEAAYNDHLEVATLLLLNGAHVNAADDDGWTPLHYAALNGHLEVATLLLSNGAIVEATTKDRDTPLRLAESDSHLEVAKLLRQYQTAKPKTFFSFIFSMDSNNTKYPDSLRCFLRHLAGIITNVHEMKLFYTLLRAILAQGLIQNDECAKEILHEALVRTTNSTCSIKEVAIYKTIIQKCLDDAMMDQVKRIELERNAENTNTGKQPFIQDMKAAIERNKKDILELRHDVESVKNNIVMLVKNIRSVNALVEKRKSAMRFKRKVEAALGMLKVVINTVFFGSDGDFVDAFVGGIVDFGDVVHLQKVASDCCGDDTESLQDGIEAAKENMGVSAKHAAELEQMDEALKEGDPLFVLGYVSVVISAQVSPNPKTLTMDDIHMNSSVPETNIVECIFPDAILSEDDEKRLEVHAAIKYGLKKDLEALLQEKEHLISMNEKDTEGRTAADLAALTGQKKLWTLLIEKGGKHEFESKNKMRKKVQYREGRSSQYLDWIEKQCT